MSAMPTQLLVQLLVVLGNNRAPALPNVVLGNNRAPTLPNVVMGNNRAPTLPNVVLGNYRALRDDYLFALPSGAGGALRSQTEKPDSPDPLSPLVSAVIRFIRMGGFEGKVSRGGGDAKRSFDSGSLWLAPNPSKRWGELFFLIYTPFWLTLCLGVIVPYRLYESFNELEYLLLGLVSALPAFLIPLLLVGKADGGKCWTDRYWVKANLWIIIFSYVGNYFWTHYFFTVLGASYTFPSWKMNNVPHTTFLLTHVCFLFYHMTSNITLRRIRHSIAHLPQSICFVTEATWVLTLSYFIAYLETIAISSFPYYDFVDRASMYKVGCLFYAIYFVVSFPMFMRVDEKDGDAWDLPRVAVDALGAAMLVTIILDLWRIFLGPIVPKSQSNQCIQPGLAWFHVPGSSLQNGSL